MGNAARTIDEVQVDNERVRRVLLVDDNLAGVQTLRILLEMEEFEVYVANTGADALKQFSELRPPLVLLDIGLPDMDGCEIARLIALDAKEARPILVGLSGWGDEKTRARAHEAGVDYFFSKPVRFEDLDIVLSRVTKASAAV